ncbi:hypothetical protein MMC06_003564 [Schaereria dolodes]|nr:hypothetical protein [Schaereria dolodes]
MALVIRNSPGIDRIRAWTPYVNFDSRPSTFDHSHPSPAIVHPGTSESSRWTTFIHGYGSRHVHDHAPFSFWNSTTQKFEGPTSAQSAWIRKQYQAVVMQTEWPIFMIFTANPPNPVPLTVGCAAAVFLPPTLFPTPLLFINTDYADPRGKDPMDFRIPKWHLPTKQHWERIVEYLSLFIDIKAITFYGATIFVEVSERTPPLSVHTLAPYLAGWTTLYHHSPDSFWTSVVSQAHDRVITPFATAVGSVQDNTDYIARGEFGPGARLESSMVTSSGPYATTSMATTAGVLVRNSTGQQRMTVACHGFENDNDVYHPDHNGNVIGGVRERAQAMDIALVELNPSVAFSNSKYFQAKPPRRLLRYDEQEQGVWHTADGMSSGLVAFMTIGMTSFAPPHHEGHPDIDYTRWRHEVVFHTTGATGGIVRDGLCGAPIVEDGEGGGVAGFFHLTNGQHSFSPVLDRLVDQTWAIV